MPLEVKAPLRAFEYLAWARTVPGDARYDLTASGMLDSIPAQGDTGSATEPWTAPLQVAEIARRDLGRVVHDRFVAAVAARYDVDPGCVIPTMGASGALMQTLIALVRSGDHVIVERPTYEPLHRAPEILGARVSRLERTFEEGWRPVPERLAQLLTSRTKVVMLSHLHNPSGVGIDPSTLRSVAELAARVGAVVLVDEVYLDYAFDPTEAGELRPACKVARNCVSWSSSTKAFGVAAARAGWIVAEDPDLARAIGLAGDYMHVYPPPATTELGRRVLEHADVLQALARAKAAAGTKVMTRWLEAETRVGWVRPSAGLTGLLRLPNFMSDVSFARHLRERYETQVVPGSMFEAPGYVRLSFGLPSGDLEQALSNVSATLDDLEARP